MRTTRKDLAQARQTDLEETIRIVESGRIEISDHIADVAALLLANGKVQKKQNSDTKSLPDPKPTTAPQVSLEKAFVAFFDTIPDNKIEGTTLATMYIREAHLRKELGSSQSCQTLTASLPALGIDLREQYAHLAIAVWRLLTSFNS